MKIILILDCKVNFRFDFKCFYLKTDDQISLKIVYPNHFMELFR